MSETWDKDEIDAETRSALEAAAAERGITLDELISDAVLLSLIEDDADDAPEAAPETAAPRFTPALAPQPEPRRAEPRESFAVNHRIEAIERKLAQTAASVDDAVTAVDRAVIGIGARLDHVAAEADDANEAAEAAIAQLRAAIDALEEHVDHAAANFDGLAKAHDLLRAQVLDDGALADQRLTIVEEVAASAESGVVALERGQEELKRAIASDFLAFAIETDEKLARHAADFNVAADALAARQASHQQEVDSALEAAASRADAVTARILDDLNATRALFTQRQAEEAQRLDQRVAQAYEHASQLAEALDERLADNERAYADLSDATRARFGEAEANVAAVAANLARSIENAHTQFAADIGRLNSEHRDAIDHIRADMAFSIERLRIVESERSDQLESALRGEIAEINDRHMGAAARLRLLDDSVSALREELGGVRAQTQERLVAFQDDAQCRIAEFAARIDALSSDAESAERRIEHANKVLSGEINRVEACTQAALAEGAQARKADYENLRRELEQVTLTQRSELEQSGRALRAALDQVRAKAEGDIAELQSGHKSTAARMTLADSALATCSRNIETTAQKLEAIEARVSAGDTRYAKDSAEARTIFEDIYKRVAAIEAYNQALPHELVSSKLEDIKARLSVRETEAEEAAERIASLARLVTKVSAQADDNATQAEDRLHKIELALADVRLDQYGAGEPAPSASSEIAELRAVLARALDEAELRLAALENADVAAEFVTLRERMEERHVALEARTARALDQLTRTIALLSKKFALEGDGDASGADDLAQTA